MAVPGWPAIPAIVCDSTSWNGWSQVLKARATLNAGNKHPTKVLLIAMFPFTRRDPKAPSSRQQLETDFLACLEGFLPKLHEIRDNFKFRNQIPILAKADPLGTLIEEFLNTSINLSSYLVQSSEGSVRLLGSTTTLWSRFLRS